MTIRKLLYYPQDEVRLRRVSRPVATAKNKRVKRLIQDLKDTLAKLPGAAIAAPQIGVYKRITVVKFGQDDADKDQPMLALINPTIIETGADEPGFDGCLSIPDIYTWDTPRPRWLRFRAMGADGKEISRRVDGIDARVLHHEIDHFDGKLFLDRLRDPNELYTPVTGTDGKRRMLRLSELRQA